jgi:purine-cytosine permease-like protein
MNAIAIRLIVFACVFGAALFGMFLRTILPEQHLSADSKDTVRLGMGTIATMAALVLGLLVASAKNFYSAPLRNALAHLGQ